MGFGLADSVGWFRIFGGGPGLKRKGGPSLLLVFFLKNLLTNFFFWAQEGPGPLRPHLSSSLHISMFCK